MRRPFVLAAAFLFIAGAVYAQQQQQQLGPVDWIFLVDTSASMRGIGKGNKDIFNDVKASLASFVNEANDGDRFALFEFDKDVRARYDGDRRDDAKSAIDSLEAEGKRTHLGAAIAKGLSRAEELRKRGDASRASAIVLFTDGKQDVRGIENPIPIDANIPHVGDAFIFFVSMGEHEPQLDAFARQTKHTEVLRETQRDKIRAIANVIRKKLPKAKPVEPLRVTLSPSTVDFGVVERGETSDVREIEVGSNKPARVEVEWEGDAGVEVLIGDAASPVQPAGRRRSEVIAPATIKVRVRVGEEAEPGAKRIALKAANAKPIALTVNVRKPSPVMRALRWIVPIAVLALIAIIWWQQQKKKNRLEGEIEIIRPSTSPDLAFIGLPRLQTQDVTLSAILPPDILGGSDARLFVRRKAGKKRIWIAAQSGSLRINDVDTPMGELYDADTIEVGDARLRFNRVGDERPLHEEAL